MSKPGPAPRATAVPLNPLLTRAGCSRAGPEVAAGAGRLLCDPVAVRDAVSPLRLYSLRPAVDGLLLVHRLVQAVTRTVLSAEETDYGL
jgi:hypothetical protein